MLLLVGCGAPAATPTSTPLPPTDKSTPIPTSEPLPESGPEMIVVTFDGDECTVSGPTELPVGEHGIVLNNLTGELGNLGLGQLIDGHMYQDLLDLKIEPGGPTNNSWVRAVITTHTWSELKGYEYSFSLDEAGEYAIWVYGANPVSVWICAPLEVIEAPSE